MNGHDDIRFERLYRAYYDRIVRFIVATFSFSLEEARDLSQETFKRVYQHMDTYAPDSDEAYLKTVARNVVLNEIRRRNTLRHGEHTTSIDEAVAVPDKQSAGPEKALSRRETVARIREAIQSLPPRPRACMLLFLQGLSYKDMAARLCVTVDAVKACLYEARKRLRVLLADDLNGLEWPE